MMETFREGIRSHPDTPGYLMSQTPLTASSLQPASGHRRRVEVAIVGQRQSNFFKSIMSLLRQDSRVKVVAEFPTLADANASGLGQIIPADLVVVLQTCSDEYSSNEVNELISRLLFGRILCCYGPWCVADGRTRDIWPVALRVSADSAPAAVTQQLEAVLTGECPLSPMSASEEVFAYRLSGLHFDASVTRGMALIVSSERPFREIVAVMLQHFGFTTQIAAMILEHTRGLLQQMKDQPELVIVDLDPPDEICADLVRLLRGNFPHSNVFGMSVFASGMPEMEGIDRILEKTEILPQLSSLLGRSAEKFVASKHSVTP